jgi:FKBP-type peptidyl-prolyl cis-trans isomerase (trigger factor)
LEVEVRELGPGKRQIAVTIPAEEVERALEEEVQEYRRRAALPGFRKG